MKLAILAMLPLLMAVPVDGLAQTPPSPTQKPPATVAPPPPAQKPAPAPRRTTTAAAPTAVTFTVTDPAGAPLSDVRVNLLGGLDRSGSTGTDGTVKFDGMRPGAYRLRFTKEGFTEFEREIEIRAGSPPPTPAVTLTPAPPPPAPPPPPKVEAPKAAAALPPPGKPVAIVTSDFIEKNRPKASEPQKVSPLACSGLAKTDIWQVQANWPDRVHADSELALYVIGGTGTLHMDGRDVALQASSFASIPRGTTYSLMVRGRNALFLLATLVGEACTP
jgi:mannose-6-phosphate isomerase-like protein (cupin superfamily)